MTRQEASARARKAAVSARRRRDPKVKAEHQTRIINMYLAGASVADIARVVELDPDTVFRIRREALADALPRRDKAVEELRETELGRLDRLQAAHWQQAMGGHVGSSRMVLSCIEARAKLLGLYAPVRVDARVRSELDAQIEALIEELEAEGLAQRPGPQNV